MVVKCESCGSEYEASLFKDDRVMLCRCGRWVEPAERIERRRREEVESCRADVDELRRRADRVTSLLLYSDLAEVDIEIEIAKLRELCRERFPERMDLFEMVYASRWRRLREQGWARASSR